MKSIQRRKQEYRRPVYQPNQLGSPFQRLKNSRLSRRLKEVFNKLYMRYRCVMPRLHALGQEIATRKIPVDIKYKGNGIGNGYGNRADYGYKPRVKKR